MTSQRQIDANRRNAKKSTGPKSTAGKRRSARNAIKHGLTANPCREQTRIWFRMILDEKTRNGIPFWETPLGLSAYNLAMAETRLNRARSLETSAWSDLLSNGSTRLPVPEKPLETEADTLAFLKEQPQLGFDFEQTVGSGKDPHALTRRVLLEVKRQDINRRFGRKPVSHALAQRYLKAAEIQRHGALMEWIRLDQPERTWVDDFYDATLDECLDTDIAE